MNPEKFFKKTGEIAKNVAKKAVSVAAFSTIPIIAAHAQTPKNVENKVEPIIVNSLDDPRLLAYKDSLDLYTSSNKIKRIYPELPKISKEEFEKLLQKNKGLTRYEFDDAKYKEDKKRGVPVKSFEDYVYSSPDSAIFEHPRYLANHGKDIAKYSSEGVEKFRIILKDGSIKEPMYLYDGKPDWTDYNVFSPDFKTQRIYSQNFEGKYELTNIFSQNIKPIRTDYYGEDRLIELGGVNTSSESTGWHKEGEKPKFEETSNKSFKNYAVPIEVVNTYPKPTQPVIYKPGAKTHDINNQPRLKEDPIKIPDKVKPEMKMETQMLQKRETPNASLNLKWAKDPNFPGVEYSLDEEGVYRDKDGVFVGERDEHKLNVIERVKNNSLESDNSLEAKE